MEDKHDADQAGGGKEEVFASDGDEPLPDIQFPVGGKQSSNNDEELIEAATMTAEEAFEVFAGKLYMSNPYDAKKKKEKGNRGGNNEDEESPLEKLARVKRELDELEKDYSASDIMKEEIGLLQAKFQDLSTSQMKQQEKLTTSMQTSISKLQQKNPTDVAESDAIPSADVESSAGQELEARLRRLEQTLGTGAGGSGNNLLYRLEALEKIRLTEKQAEHLQKLGKVIRQDMEAAAKARNKLSSSFNNVEDSKAIAALYDQLQQTNGISKHLPALTQRLGELADIHVEAATRQSRLHALERLTAGLETQVQSVETSLSALESTMQENAKTMQASIEALEGRMK